MNESSLQVPERRLWLAILGRGFVGLAAGVVLLSNPWMSLRAIAGVIVAYMLADGVLRLYAAKRTARGSMPSWQLALGGVVDVVAAAVVLFMPAVLPMRLAAGLRAVVTGSCDVLWTRGTHLSELLTMGGVTAVALGAVLLGWPGPATVALPWLVGLEAMVSGALLFAGGASEIRSVPEVAPQSA